MNTKVEVLVAKTESVLTEFFEDLLKARLGTNNQSSFCKTRTLSLIKKDVSILYETSLPVTLILEIFTQIDGCHPLLLEKWTLILSFASSQENTGDFEANNPMDDLQKLTTTLPKLGFNNLELSISSVSSKQWPKGAKKVEKSPRSPVKVNFAGVFLEFFCEFLNGNCLPEIKMQDLGTRRRLSSVEIGDLDYGELDFYSNTDEPITCLDQMVVNTKNCFDCLELTTQKCNLEHLCIGFTPLSHTICSENASYESMSECFGQVIDVFGESSLTEDAEISVYKINCDKMNKVQLFSATQEVSLDMLKESLRRMKLTLDLL